MINRLLNYALVFLAAMFCLMWVTTSCEKSELEARIHEVTTERDSLAADAAAERQREAGFEVIFGTSDPGELGRRLNESDSLNAQLARDYRASRIEIQSLTDMVASATGSGESEAVVIEEDPEYPVYGGTVVDEVMELTWRFSTFPPPQFFYDYRVDLPAEIISSVTGDGRLMISARPLVDGATLNIREVYYSAPDPVIIKETDWKKAILYFVLGSATCKAFC